MTTNDTHTFTDAEYFAGTRAATETEAPTQNQTERPTEPQSPSERIIAAVESWPGVASGYGTRGEFAFKVGHREVGHLHGDHSAHFFFPKDVWHELHGEGRITHHPVFPDKVGPAARVIRTGADVEDVISMMRLNYDRIEALRPA